MPLLRTVAGFPGLSYSRDRGANWTDPVPLTRTPGAADVVPHPRAANLVWKLSRGPHAGRFLHWHHNHPGTGYLGRNPCYLSGGVEEVGPDGPVVRWGEPRVVLFSPDPAVRVSYPDLVEDPSGRLFLTATQKTVARVHEVDAGLIDTLFAGLSRE